MNYEFKVGDKVVTTRSRVIGTVIRITPKRKDVVVDFGNYQSIFRPDGWQKGEDIWSSMSTIIEPLTPEIEREIKQNIIINKCKKLFKIKERNLTFDQAARILEVLEDEDNG